MTEPLISVIVPIYNIAPYLERCIESIINQTYRKLQIILVDDGSTDASSQICDRYAKQDKRIEVIHKANGGLVSARKAGIQAADGIYAAYVDGDDWIEADMYECLLQEMLCADADMVETDHFREMDGEGILMKSKLPYGCYEADKLFAEMLCDQDFNECKLRPFLWSKLFKRELLRAAQSMVSNCINFAEDVAVTYPYVLQCKKVVLLDYAGYHYVQRQNSIANSRRADELYCDMTLIRYLKDIFMQTDASKVLLPALNQYTKTLLLLRQLAFFDNLDEDSVLTPFGGIKKTEHVIVYGAGKIGQNVYNYLKEFEQITICDWLDLEYGKYQKWGLPVHAPQAIEEHVHKNCKVIIAINSRKPAAAVQKFLVAHGMLKEQIQWLTEEFVADDRDVFERYDCKQIAVCGFRQRGKALYQRLLRQGYRVPYIIERNYEALQKLDDYGLQPVFEVPSVVGFNEDKKFYQRAELILVSEDMDFNLIRENMQLADIPVQILPEAYFTLSE